MKSFRLWVISILSFSLIVLLAIMGLVIYIDPWFHFHGPIEGIAYSLDIGNERYQNDGIVKHFKYDALITGSSMIEVTKTSDIDYYFGVNSIKVPFAGSTYKETAQVIEQALKYNDTIKVVIRGLDYGHILDNKDDMKYVDYPEYLYDDNIFNDTNYIFNKRALSFVINDLLLTVQGGTSTEFDEYANWENDYEYGLEVVSSQYDRPERLDRDDYLSEADKITIQENFNQNVIAPAIQHPEVEFYYFFTPYSIYYFDSINQTGELKRQLEAEKYAIELMLQYENIHVFSFFTNYEITCNLDYYRDNGHYSGTINSWIVKQMSKEKYRLNKDNYLEYCNDEYEFYTNYNYDELFR